MHEAYVINPKSRKGKCKCCLCSITYNRKDYEALYETKKIIYLSYLPPSLKRSKTVCHGCLMTMVKNYSGDDVKISVQIIDKARKSGWKCYNYANDIEDSIMELSFFP